MCCVFMLLVMLGPRFAGVIWWIADPARWDQTFSRSVWPVLTLLFIPWSTLMYVSVKPGGVSGFDWFWLAIALLADVASYGGGYRNREQAPGYPYQRAV